MNDYTNVFNAARIAAGREPISKRVTIAHEGMRTGCGCEVIRASNKTFTIRHDGQSCKYGQDGKQRVGDGQRNAIGSVWGDENIIAMTNPFCGLFPHEQV